MFVCIFFGMCYVKTICSCFSCNEKTVKITPACFLWVGGGMRLVAGRVCMLAKLSRGLLEGAD